MCTVSIVPRERGFRLACNRDEQVSRPAAMPPRVRSVDGVRVVWPLDPLSGGTWIGVNDAGLAACLLNRHPPAQLSSRGSVISRGTIIPLLLRHRDVPSAVSTVLSLHPGSFQLFTLLLVQRSTLARVTNDGDTMRLRICVLQRPMMFTSSALGDEQVIAPRRALFARLVARSAHPLAAQLAFHDHVWPACPAISVRMRRAGAATVSQTLITMGRACTRIHYRSLQE